ncbi:Abi-alpha family protein [Methylobacterium sp. 1973]|uniref:Abi-alpha family protein n=1 Tax=Methylobacterium sp. 1973 TaxID=3156421 RepID=UPI003390898E
MTVDPKLAIEVAKVVAKEVYGDAFAPAAREIGTALGDLARTMRVAGLDFGAITRERVERLFERALSKVPPQRRIAPQSDILGPILEGVRYREEGTPIEEAFRRLLSRATDVERVGEAHPSFPGIINRISPDEAHMLVKLSEEPFILEGNMIEGVVRRICLDEGQLIKEVQYLENMLLYINNLQSCGLINVAQGAIPAERQAELFRTDRWDGRMCLGVSLTPLGDGFVGACLRDC